MESPAENPSKAAEYLKELNKIIETQQELLEKQKRRIDELEQQVAKLYHENAFLQDEHHRHLATCRLQQGILPAYPAGPGPVTLGAIQENAKHEKSEGESSRSISEACCSSLREPQSPSSSHLAEGSDKNILTYMDKRVIAGNFSKANRTNIP